MIMQSAQDGFRDHGYHGCAVPWPILSIAEQLRSAAAYKAQLDAELDQRYQNGLRGISKARQKMMQERCERAVAILRETPGGLSEPQLAVAMGLTKGTVRALARTLLEKGSQYGVMRTQRAADRSAARFVVV